MHCSRQLLTATSLAVSALLSACGGSGSDTGTLRLALTDAPACGFDTVFVTIEKVRVHKSGSANEGDDGWSEVALTPAKRVDLLSLTNGALAELGQTLLPAGKYTQMRFVLAANGAANPLANAVKPTGGVETAGAAVGGYVAEVGDRFCELVATSTRSLRTLWSGIPISGLPPPAWKHRALLCASLHRRSTHGSR